MKKIHSQEISYAPKPNQAIWYATDELPEVELITSCFGLLIYQDQMVLVQHISRGEEIPGGHREGEENALECFKREIQEECGISQLSEIKMVARQDIEVLAPRPEGYKYPYPKSYQVVFSAQVVALDEFIAQLDSKARVLIPLAEIKTHAIYQQYKFLLDLVII